MIRHRFAFLASAVVLLTLPVRADNTKPPNVSSEKMTPQTKMLVMRDLMSEHVFARCMIPMGVKGLDIKSGVVSPDQMRVAELAAENGAAAKPGDKVVITNVVIKEKSIVFEINGGAKKKEKWYQHVQVGMNGTMGTPGGPPKNLNAKGSVVTLQFDKYVPEVTGEQVRNMLSPVF